MTPRTRQLGVTPRTPLFEGKNPENQKTKISIKKGRLLLVNDQRFQPNTTYVSILEKFPKKSPLFLTLVKFRWSQSPVFVQFIITLLLMNILI